MATTPVSFHSPNPSSHLCQLDPVSRIHSYDWKVRNTYDSDPPCFIQLCQIRSATVSTLSVTLCCVQLWKYPLSTVVSQIIVFQFISDSAPLLIRSFYFSYLSCLTFFIFFQSVRLLESTHSWVHHSFLTYSILVSTSLSLFLVS